MFGGETGMDPVQYFNKMTDPARFAMLEQQAQQDAVSQLPEYTLEGLDINIDIDPSIAQQRGALYQAVEGMKTQSQGTITDLRRQIKQVGKIALPEVDERGFRRLREQATAQRDRLRGLDQQLDRQIMQLNNLYQQLGSNQNRFIEARVSPLYAQRERAKRDAARRGISGPLATMATNPIDTQISQQRAEAAQEVLEAQMAVREQQRAVLGTKAAVSDSYEQIRMGELTAIAERYKQVESRFAAKMSKETLTKEIYGVIQESERMIENMIMDQRTLTTDQLAQELAELGLGLDIATMIVNSQLGQPTAQASKGTTIQSSAGTDTGQADMLGGFLRGYSFGGTLAGGGATA